MLTFSCKFFVQGEGGAVKNREKNEIYYFIITLSNIHRITAFLCPSVFCLTEFFLFDFLIQQRSHFQSFKLKNYSPTVRQCDIN